ncbi:MAG TPA: penicillin-binding protein 2 [Candidatus Limnocylindria bacterium]|jgi:cell division protein FtsI/penicillin-binding protein 2|nr:penicillin-binding protein 2 [Candidatus Limnocylindria bacterium]
MNPTSQTQRLWGIVALYCVGFAVLAGRLVFVQVIEPAHPSEHSADATLRRVMRPARRGSVLDANGVPLVLSQFAVTVRADPSKLGEFSPEVARIAAPLLGLPETEVLSRLQPSVYYQTVTNWVTNRNLLIPQIVQRERVRHNNGIFTNLPMETWEALEQAVATNRYAHELELAAVRTNLLQAARMAKKALPLWDIPARLRQSRATKTQLKALNTEIALVRSNANECRVAGLYPEIVELRRYPLEHRAAHVLGYTTNSNEFPPPGSRLPVKLLGATGIEQRFDTELQGSHGLIETRRAGGRELVPLRQREIPPTDGLNVMLTIDANIQAIVEDMLDEGMRSLNPQSISAIVVRPRTGEILALANRPTWNPNTRRVSSLEMLQNRAIMQPAEPGSTFKLVTYSAALDLGLVNLEQTINCEGGRWNVPGTRRVIRDDQGENIGLTTVEDAFAHSSNVGAVKLGLQVGTNSLLKYIRNFGFLARTGVECGEVFGLVRLNKQGQPYTVTAHGESAGGIPGWDGLTSSSLPFGYGLYVTPLQTAMAAAAIANDGVLMEPRLVHRLTTADGKTVRQFEPHAVRQVIRPETAHEMVRAMRRVVLVGTGKLATLADFDVAGKTGTAKKWDPVRRAYASDHYYASFVGFFPAENPEVCIMLAADDPSLKGKASYGGKACAPLFAKIGQEIASYLALPPTPRTNDATALLPPPGGAAALAARP